MNNIITDNHAIKNKIFTSRDLRVMLNTDLTELYGLSEDEIKIVEGKISE